MENEQKSDAKQDLPIRQNLVDTALTFLLNPNVKQRSDDDKIAFLKKKGLTESEITEAFSRAQYETSVVSNEEDRIINAYPLPPYSPNYFGYFFRNFSSTCVSLIVIVYVFHPIYKHYIEPWLFGSKSKQSEVSALNEQLIQLNKSVSQLTSTVATLEETVSHQIVQDRTYLYEDESVPRTVKNVFDEVTNVKGLLLNRFSFPPPPPIAGAQNGATPKVVSIPKWQLQEPDKEKPNGDPKQEEKTTTSESKSLEEGKSSAEDKNPEACMTNGSSTELEARKEDAEMAIQERSENVEERPLDGDSDAASHNHLSGSASTDPKSSLNENQESTKDAEEK